MLFCLSPFIVAIPTFVAGNLLSDAYNPGVFLKITCFPFFIPLYCYILLLFFTIINHYMLPTSPHFSGRIRPRPASKRSKVRFQRKIWSRCLNAQEPCPNLGKLWETRRKSCEKWKIMEKLEKSGKMSENLRARVVEQFPDLGLYYSIWA